MMRLLNRTSIASLVMRLLNPMYFASLVMRMLNPVFVASLVMLATACAPAIQEEARPLGRSGAMQHHHLVHDGVEREYFVFTPPGRAANTTLPMLLFLHGYGGTATGTEAETTNGLNHYAAKYGYVVVYPQGTWFTSNGKDGQPYIVTSWNDLAGNQDQGPEGPLCSDDAPRYPCPPECDDCGRCGWASCHDDVGFLKRVVDEVAAALPVDPDQWYVSGFSNGSMMAHRLACETGSPFAAVALVGGRLERGFQCAPDHPVPLLQIAGSADTVVPYDGARPDSEFFYTSTATVEDGWARSNQCSEESAVWPEAASYSPKLECTSRCAGTDRETLNCLWHEGTHVWPGYPAGHGSGGYCVRAEQQTSMPQRRLCVTPDLAVDVWGSRLIFDFFERHRSP